MPGGPAEDATDASAPDIANVELGGTRNELVVRALAEQRYEWHR